MLSWASHIITNHCRYIGTKLASNLIHFVVIIKFAKHWIIANLSPAQDQQLQIIYLLHEAGADVTIKSGSGVTPIAMALDPSVDFKIGAVLLGRYMYGLCSYLSYVFKLQKNSRRFRIKVCGNLIYLDIKFY